MSEHENYDDGETKSRWVRVLACLFAAALGGYLFLMFCLLVVSR
jgi:hypothetical protein